METNYFKKGAQVIYHSKEWKKVLWGENGYGWVPTWERAVILCQPRDEYGKFTNDFYYEDDVTVKLKNEEGKIFYAKISEIEPDRPIDDLSDNEFKKLWKEIRRHSMYYEDFRNSLGVFENVVMDYYEGFSESLFYDAKDKNPEIDEEEIWEMVEKRDNVEEFADYCRGVEWCYKIAA